MQLCPIFPGPVRGGVVERVVDPVALDDLVHGDGFLVVRLGPLG